MLRRHAQSLPYLRDTRHHRFLSIPYRPNHSTQLSHPTMSAPKTPPPPHGCKRGLARCTRRTRRPTRAAFAAQFDAVFARDAKVVLNHVPSPRTTYVTKLREEHFAAVHESVDWRELIELSPEGRCAGHHSALPDSVSLQWYRDTDRLRSVSVPGRASSPGSSLRRAR